MKVFSCYVVIVVVMLMVSVHDAAPPLFMSAITSALATIPFTGGPLTTGLMGAKLAVGTKLLYFLGYFGRKSKPKKAPKSKSKSKPKVPASAAVKSQSLGGGGGFPQTPSGGFPQTPAGGFGQGQFNMDQYQMFEALRAQGIDPNTAMQMISNGGFGNPNMPQGGGFGAFPMQGGGFGSQQFPGQGGGFGSQQFPGQGFGSQQFPGQGFGAQFPGQGFAPQQFPPQGFGSNAAFAGQAGFGMNQGFVGQSGFDSSAAFGNQGSGLQSAGASSSQEQAVETNQNSDSSPDFDDESQSPDEGSDDIESFFTFLKDMDDNTCISRLVCDIGKDPSFLGDFSENIYGIVTSLDVQPSSGAYPFVKIMDSGKAGENCAAKFLECGDSAYEIVKNVAPSVGVPDNIDPAAINRL